MATLVCFLSTTKYDQKIIIIVGAAVFFTTWWITTRIREQYLSNDPMLHQLRDLILPICPEAKDLKLFKGEKSYTINKEKIYLCLKDENDSYYSTNMLVYVLLHEIAHMRNKSDIGHTKNFYDIFNDLLSKAKERGIYDPDIPPVEDYCIHT